MAKDMTKGLFITFDGPDGCGKSTHSHQIAADLIEDGLDVVETKEPGGTSFGQSIRKLILHSDATYDPYAELLLFEADRAQHMSEVILPALAENKIVICDRFSSATLAYQGYGLEMPMDKITIIDSIATRGKIPDLTIILDVEVEEGLKRTGRSGGHDSIEKRDKAFHARVRKGYLSIAAGDPERFSVFKTDKGFNDVYSEVRKRVYELISKYKIAG
jgi:dTMP kinase